MIFLTLKEVIDDHALIIRTYGGADGIRDIGLLASALEMPKAMVFGELLHPTVFDQAAAYLFHIICNHPFVDGNKRTAVVTALTFLKQNRMQIKLSKKHSIEFEELVVQCADGKVQKQHIALFFERIFVKERG